MPDFHPQGDAGLDRLFPLTEYFEVPESTARLIRQTKESGGRIVALGTTVTRAIETAFADQSQVRTRGYTSLKLGGSSRLRVVDTLITGMHEPGTSHSELMQALAAATYWNRPRWSRPFAISFT